MANAPESEARPPTDTDEVGLNDVAFRLAGQLEALSHRVGKVERLVERGDVVQPEDDAERRRPPTAACRDEHGAIARRQMPRQEAPLTVADLVSLLGMNKKTIYARVKTQAIPGVLFTERPMLFSARAIYDWLDGR